MKPEQVWQEFITLPLAAQQQVSELIATLKQGERSGMKAPVPGAPQLSEEPFIGIWRNRSDMTDSSGWVRETRSKEWSPDR